MQKNEDLANIQNTCKNTRCTHKRLSDCGLVFPSQKMSLNILPVCRCMYAHMFQLAASSYINIYRKGSICITAIPSSGGKNEETLSNNYRSIYILNMKPQPPVSISKDDFLNVFLISFGSVMCAMGAMKARSLTYFCGTCVVENCIIDKERSFQPERNQ